MVEVVTLAHALAHSGEDRVAAMLGCDVTDELLNKHRLPHPSATKEPHLTALKKRGDKVNCFNSGLENLCFRRLFVKGRWRAMNWESRGFCINRALTVDGLAKHVKEAPKSCLANWHLDRGARCKGRFA